MKTCIRTLSLAAALTFAAINAQAAFIDPTEIRISPSNTVEETETVESFFPGEDLEFLVKWNGDGDSIDELGSNFTAADVSLITLSNATGSSVDITWDLTSIGAEIWGAVVKAGPTSNVFIPVDALARMDFGAADTLVGPDNKAISHISLIGKTGLSTSVPDTKNPMVLLALGLGTIAGVSRKLSPTTSAHPSGQL